MLSMALFCAILTPAVTTLFGLPILLTDWYCGRRACALCELCTLLLGWQM